MNQHRFILLLASAFLLSVTMFQPAPVTAQTVVIVNESVSTSILTQKELMDIYTLNRAHWDDGSRISVFDLKSGKPKESFLSHVGMTEDELKRIWLRKQFTGKARPPRALATEEEVVDHVSRTPGAIGYVSERAIKSPSSVRIIAKVK
jgi:ABC-type phosphate transport system substrate-binding protein